MWILGRYFILLVTSQLEYIHTHIYIYYIIYKYCTCMYMYTGGAKIIERKLRSTKVRLFTVPYCSIIHHNYVFLGRYEKKLILTYSIFFHRSIILVCSINCVFHHFSHIYQFRSIFSVL